MGEVVAGVVESDEGLLRRARDGDRSAFGVLYLRHEPAARFVARQTACSEADADDAVAEAFARVFAALRRLDPARVEFRRYLLAAVRNAARDQFRRRRRVDLREAPPDQADLGMADDGAMSGFERGMLAEALAGLPDRWRGVLWLTEVEGLRLTEVAQLYGMRANAVAALAYRARKRLRQTYLQAHLKADVPDDCSPTVERLGGYLRGRIKTADRAVVDAHLVDCAGCRRRVAELADLNATLRQALVPVASLLVRTAELAQPVSGGTPGLFGKAAAGVAVAVLALSGAGDSLPQAPPPVQDVPAAVSTRGAEAGIAGEALDSLVREPIAVMPELLPAVVPDVVGRVASVTAPLSEAPLLASPGVAPAGIAAVPRIPLGEARNATSVASRALRRVGIPVNLSGFLSAGR